MEKINRQKKIEKFLLDKDKAIFENIEEFSSALQTLIAKLDGVDLENLESLAGSDGHTPQKGVDYFTPEEIDGLEKFILDHMPKEDIDFPSKASAEKAIKRFVGEAIAKLPKPKDGKPGIDGKDGSPDTGVQVIKKIRSVGKNQGLKVKDIRGMNKVVSRVKENTDDIDDLKKEVNEKVVQFGNNSFVDVLNDLSDVTVAATAPSSPSIGDLWLDTS